MPAQCCRGKFVRLNSGKFVVRLCIIRRASRVSRTDKSRAFCSKIGNSVAARLQLGGRPYTRFPGPKLPSLIIRHANVQSRDIKAKYYNLRITPPIPSDIGFLPTYN
jgi:hypothetical protein